MGELELLLLEYYRSRPLHMLTSQEVDELCYLEVKLGLEKWQEPKEVVK